MPDAGDSLQSKYSAPGVSWLNKWTRTYKGYKDRGISAHADKTVM